MYYVYILQVDEKGGKNWYIGYTSDLRSRFHEHLAGQVKTTKGRHPELLYYEAYREKYLALRREKMLKRSGSCYIGLLKRLGMRD